MFPDLARDRRQFLRVSSPKQKLCDYDALKDCRHADKAAQKEVPSQYCGDTGCDESRQLRSDVDVQHLGDLDERNEQVPARLALNSDANPSRR